MLTEWELHRSIKLPVSALLKQFKTFPNQLTRHFDLLYIHQGIDRIPVDVSFTPHLVLPDTYINIVFWLDSRLDNIWSNFPAPTLD